MNGPKYAVKVGLFVLAGLVVLGAMAVMFSKSGSLFARTYELRLRANSVSGLKSGSAVLLSGVPVGTVRRAEFAPGGKGVIITVRINRGYTIHADARFLIQQLGLLGDQYVAIHPGANQGPILQPGDMVPVHEPFNFQETVRSATDLLEDVKQSTKTINTLIERLDRTVMSEASVSNATVAIANFRLLSQRVLTMVDKVNQLVETNSRPILLSVSNLVFFSQEMDLLAAELQQMVATNKGELAQGIRSLDATARVLEGLARSVEQGQGLAGALVKDEALKESFVQMVQNLQTASSNISYHGVLYKPRHPKTNAPTTGLAVQPKSPFQ